MDDDERPTSPPPLPTGPAGQPTREAERRLMRLILILVALGWLSALGLMAFAAIFWDRG